MTYIPVIALQVLFAVLVVWYYFQTKDRLEKLDRKIRGLEAKLALMLQQSTFLSEMDQLRLGLGELRSLVSNLALPRPATRGQGKASRLPVLDITTATGGSPVDIARAQGRSRAEVELLMRLRELQDTVEAGTQL